MCILYFRFWQGNNTVWLISLPYLEQRPSPTSQAVATSPTRTRMRCVRHGSYFPLFHDGSNERSAIVFLTSETMEDTNVSEEDLSRQSLF